MHNYILKYFQTKIWNLAILITVSESRDSASESLLGSREEDSGEKKGQDKNGILNDA